MREPRIIVQNPLLKFTVGLWAWIILSIMSYFYMIGPLPKPSIATKMMKDLGLELMTVLGGPFLILLGLVMCAVVVALFYHLFTMLGELILAPLSVEKDD